MTPAEKVKARETVLLWTAITIATFAAVGAWL